MKVYPVVALEFGADKITAIVGELLADGSISIMGKGEYAHAPSESGIAFTGSDLKNALGAAEESAEACIVKIHLVMPCENIHNLVGAGSIPVLTTLKDPDIQKHIDLIEGIDCAVDDVVFSGYCAALAVTTTEQRAQGVAVIDIGSGMITFVAFAAGQPATIGASKITGKVDAEAIQRVCQSIKQAGIKDQLAGGILLTGEGAWAQGVLHLVETTFGMKCSLGLPRGFIGLDAVLTRPDYAACLGMIRYAYTDGLSKLIRPSPLVAALKKVFRL